MKFIRRILILTLVIVIGLENSLWSIKGVLYAATSRKMNLRFECEDVNISEDNIRAEVGTTVELPDLSDRANGRKFKRLEM